MIPRKTARLPQSCDAWAVSKRLPHRSPQFVLDFMSASHEDTGGPGGLNRPATPGVRHGTVYAAAAERRTHYKAWAESRAGA